LTGLHDFLSVFYGLLNDLKTNQMPFKFSLTLLLICFSLLTIAQAPIDPVKRYDGTLDHQKTKQPASILEFRYPERDLEAALERYVEKLGVKVKFVRGLNYAKQVKFKADDARYFDLYYKVEGSGRGASSNSILSVILAEPGEDILLRDPKNQEVANATAASPAAQAFFDGLGAAVGAYDLEKRISEQEDVVKKSEKKQSDLEKKKQKLEKELAENSEDLKKNASELEKAKAVLEQIRAERKN
jgi:hypothetical protein